MNSSDSCPLRKNLEILYELYGDTGKDALLCSNPKCRGAPAVSICLKCQKAMCKRCDEFHSLFFDEGPGVERSLPTNNDNNSEMVGHTVVPVYEVYMPRESLDVIKCKCKELHVRYEARQQSLESERNRVKRVSTEKPIVSRQSTGSFMFTAPAKSRSLRPAPPTYGLPPIPQRTQSQQQLQYPQAQRTMQMSVGSSSGSDFGGSGGDGSSSSGGSSSNGDEPLPPGWIRLVDEKTKKHYYYNKSLQKTSWKRPSADDGNSNMAPLSSSSSSGIHSRRQSQNVLVLPSMSTSKSPRPSQQQQQQQHGGAPPAAVPPISPKSPKPYQSTAPVPLTPKSPKPLQQQQQQEVLPPGWIKLFNEKAGRYYYYNKALQKTSWSRPTQ